MRKLFILFFLLLLSVSPLSANQETVILEGWLSAFDREPPEGTLAYRLEVGDIQPGYDTYIATADCGLIGKTGVLTYVESGMQLSVQVFDCSGEWDGGVVDGVSTLTEGGYAAELDYASWQAYGLGRVRIELSMSVVLVVKGTDKGEARRIPLDVKRI